MGGGQVSLSTVASASASSAFSGGMAQLRLLSCGYTQLAQAQWAMQLDESASSSEGTARLLQMVAAQLDDVHGAELARHKHRQAAAAIAAQASLGGLERHSEGVISG